MSKGSDPNREELLNMPTEEYQRLLNNPPSREVQHYMGLAPREMPRRVNEGIVTAFNYLGMLPDAGN